VARPRIAITPGDPRGVGPEVARAALSSLASEDLPASLVLVGPDGLLELDAVPTPVAGEPSAHGPDEQAGAFAAEAIERAVEMCLAGDLQGIVTAPLHKPSLHAAGRPVPGQTEMLAALSRTERVGMLMAAERTRLGAPLRVLLATTHLALRDVADAVDKDLLVAQTELLSRALETDWELEHPSLALCALNPHASDGGLFGTEEASVYAPALERLRSDGVSVQGPVPADTVFSRALAGEFDAVVAPYHDVGMAAFKTVAFGSGVNVTIGLPFIRTSPDHGTAFDIVGTGRADSSSMQEAIRLAARLANARFGTGGAQAP
jgi:4-hydroxythreonine-4-phosphate dehydrogenase